MPSCASTYDDLRVATEARRVSIEGREPSIPRSPSPLPLAPFLPLTFFIRRYVVMINLVHAFLIFLHSETVSSAVLTLLKSTNRCTGALLRSLSRTVLLQSSTASLIAVTTIMTIRGTAFNAGFEAPKIWKIYRMYC